MPRKEYAWSERQIKDDLETILWCEIARRKSQLVEGENFNALQVLFQKMVDFLTEYRDDLTEEFNESINFYVYDICDAIQFDRNFFNEPKTQYMSFNDKEFDALTKCIEHFDLEAREKINKINYLDGFAVSSFLHKNDLEELFSWWIYINDKENRKLHNLTKAYGHDGRVKRKEKDGPGEYDSIIFHSHNAVVPKKIRRVPFNIYDTKEHNVTIDGQTVNNKLVLVFDLNKKLPPTDQIINSLIWSHYSAAPKPTPQQYPDLETKKQDCSLNDGDSELSDDSPEFYTLPPESLLSFYWGNPENHTLIKKIDSVDPLIRGLICWDRYKKMKGKESIEVAAYEIFLLLSNEQELGIEVDTIKSDYHSINQKIQIYIPNNLHWYNS